MFFASPAMAAMAGQKPGTLVAIPASRKRLIVVFQGDQLETRAVHSIGEWLASVGYDVAILMSVDSNAPDIRIFDLDGAPAPDTGLLQEIKAFIEEAKK